MTEHIAISREVHMVLFRALYGRDPITLRNPFTGEIFWIERGRT